MHKNETPNGASRKQEFDVSSRTQSVSDRIDSFSAADSQNLQIEIGKMKLYRLYKSNYRLSLLQISIAIVKRKKSEMENSKILAEFGWET